MSITHGLKQRTKALLPAGVQTRRLPSGIGRGLRIGVDLRDGHIGLYLGLYELELNRHLRRLCPPGARCFDLGGHVGYDALVLAKLSRTEVVTVEASAELCDRIADNVRANPTLDPLITVVNAYVDESSSQEGHLTIDELSNRYFAPDFIKVDIEGGELDALRGGLDTIRDRHPGLLVEVHSAELEASCMALLHGLGYAPVVVDQRRFLRDHRPASHNRWIVADGYRA